MWGGNLCAMVHVCWSEDSFLEVSSFLLPCLRQNYFCSCQSTSLSTVSGFSVPGNGSFCAVEIIINLESILNSGKLCGEWDPLPCLEADSILPVSKVQWVVPPCRDSE